MKKIFTQLLISFTLLQCFSAKSQMAQNYSFNSSTATYTPITGGTVLGTSNNWNNIFNYIPIGFTFNYLGQNFTDVHVLSSGSIKFGAPIDGYQAISSGSLVDNILTQDTVVCFLDMYELWGAGVGVMQYTTTGIAPNRVFTIQWSNYALNYSEDLNFQLKLYETTNKIQAHYGLMILDLVNGTSVYGQLGLRGEFLNLYDIVGLEAYSPSGLTSWANPAVGTTTLAYPAGFLDLGPPQVKPSNGRTHTWSPPSACSGIPNAGTTQVYDYSPTNNMGYAFQIIDTACTGVTLFMQLSGSTVASGLTYQWQLSANNSTWVAIPSATQSSLPTTFTSNVNTWYRCVLTCGSNTAASIPHKVTVAVPLTAPTVANSTIACLGGPVYLDVLSIGSGFSFVNYYSLTYTWQTSSNNTTWTAVPSQTNSTYSTFYTSPTYYKAIVACGINTVSSISVFVNTYTGTPTAGTTVATFTSACAVGQPVAINLTGATTSISVPGLSYQWQSSPNGITYSSISGGTNYPIGTSLSYSYQPLFLNTIYYQNVVSCGANSSTSIPIGIINTGTPLTFTTAPFLENFDNFWQSSCSGTNNIPLNNCWTASTFTGNSSWRRQDDGASAFWTLPSTGTVAPLAGAGCANFHGSQITYTNPPYDGNLQLFINLSGTSNYNLSFYHKNPTGDDDIYIQISTNAGITYSNIAYFGSGDYNTIEQNWNKKIINLGTVNSPSCIVRFKGTISNFGPFADDLAIDSLEIKSCSPNITVNSSNTIICSGSTVSLGVVGSAGNTYSWSTGASVPTISVNPNSSAIYSVTAINGTNTACAITQTIAITVNPNPTVSISSATNTICNGNSANLNATGANTYSWSNGASGASNIVSPTVTTIYTATGTSTAGCIGTNSITLNVINCTVGFANNSIASTNYAVYPNPTNGAIAIGINANLGTHTFEVFDVAGKLVYTKTINTAQTTLNINELANGLYTYKISNSSVAVGYGKLVKQ